MQSIGLPVELIRPDDVARTLEVKKSFERFWIGTYSSLASSYF